MNSSTVAISKGNHKRHVEYMARTAEKVLQRNVM
jgi:hypothetical protein